MAEKTHNSFRLIYFLAGKGGVFGTAAQPPLSALLL